MRKFEYKVFAVQLSTMEYESKVHEFEQLLNQLGGEGWRLVQITDSEFCGLVAAFEREVHA